MNIFFLSILPRRCSRYHVDKHVVKMILELAQLLYSSHWVTSTNDDWVPKGLKPYKKTHVNHPMAVWVRQAKSNYVYTSNLALELCKEYTHRYGKVHKTTAHLLWLSVNFPVFDKNAPYSNPDTFFAVPFLPDMTPIPLCMPPSYHTKNVVHAYRDYYLNEKNKLSSWKKRDPPYWYAT